MLLLNHILAEPVQPYLLKYYDYIIYRLILLSFKNCICSNYYNLIAGVMPFHQANITSISILVNDSECPQCNRIML
jgi:hypothetical protein